MILLKEVKESIWCSELLDAVVGNCEMSIMQESSDILIIYY